MWWRWTVAYKNPSPPFSAWSHLQVDGTPTCWRCGDGLTETNKAIIWPVMIIATCCATSKETGCLGGSGVGRDGQEAIHFSAIPCPRLSSHSCLPHRSTTKNLIEKTPHRNVPLYSCVLMRRRGLVVETSTIFARCATRRAHRGRYRMWGHRRDWTETPSCFGACYPLFVAEGACKNRPTCSLENFAPLRGTHLVQPYRLGPECAFSRNVVGQTAPFSQ